MVINNTSDANKYYYLVNEIIDKYIKNGYNLKSLNKNLKSRSRFYKSFIEDNKLTDIDNIGIVIDDVIDDRCAINENNIKTFNEFIFENNNKDKVDIYDGISELDIKFQKVLSNNINIGLSMIDIYNEKQHIYSAIGYDNKNRYYAVFSKNDLKIIRDNIIHNITSELMDSKISLKSYPMKISLNDILDNDKTRECLSTVLMDNDEYCLLGNEYEFFNENSDYVIFIYHITNNFQ